MCPRRSIGTGRARNPYRRSVLHNTLGREHFGQMIEGEEVAFAGRWSAVVLLAVGAFVEIDLAERPSAERELVAGLIVLLLVGKLV